MGAIDFVTTSEGRDAKEAFQNAIQEAVYYHGVESYSGTIKEKDAFVEIPLPKGKDPEMYAYELIDACDERVSDKWGPAGCFLINRRDDFQHIAHKAERIAEKRSGTRQWVTQYHVVSASNERLKKFSKQGDAEKFAKEAAIKSNTETFVKIVKELLNEDNEVCRFIPKSKTVKIPGAIKEYMFFGIASY